MYVKAILWFTRGQKIRAGGFPVYPREENMRSATPSRCYFLKAKFPLRGSSRSRDGAALLVVLLFVGLAVTYGYAALRTQGVSQAVVRNGLVQAGARQAALTGAIMALKRMHTGSWQGVDSTFSARVDQNSEFMATYTTGDGELFPDDPRYKEYPYRVTVEVLGRCQDPARPQCSATARLRMVVRLVPRAVAPAPTGWSDLTGFTLCQWRAGTCEMQIPFRVTGPVRLRERLDLANSIAWSSSARWDYCQGLRHLQLWGMGDFRPFSGPVMLPYGRQASGTISLLQIALGVSTMDATSAAVFSWITVPELVQYRLYRNGKLYSSDALLLDSLGAATLSPNPMANPLGIRVREGDLQLLGDVRIEGTLLLRGGKSSLKMSGMNNQLESLPVPDYPEALHAKEIRVRLPAAIVEESIRVEPGGFLGGKGLLLAQKEFSVQKSSQEVASLDWLGNIAAETIRIHPREEWIQSDKWWNQVYTQYQGQISWGDPNFPRWLQNRCGLHYQPGITIRPLQDGTRSHWTNLADGIFIPHPDDVTPLEAGSPGLRWEILSLRWLDPQY